VTCTMCHVFGFGGLRLCPSCSCVTLCFISVDMITPNCSYCGQNADICMKENGICVSHYSPSRRDEMTLMCLCPSENSFSELILFLMVDQDVLYIEELESLTRVTCESCEIRVFCVYCIHRRTGMEGFGSRILCLNGFNTHAVVIL
jgi:hypothetical protein